MSALEERHRSIERPEWREVAVSGMAALGSRNVRAGIRGRTQSWQVSTSSQTLRCSIGEYARRASTPSPPPGWSRWVAVVLSCRS